MRTPAAPPRIALLPEVVRNQIAAGEVIERPASVVKELLENALDAAATRITVDLEEGGVRLVRVTDDGSGMGSEDLELAFAAHATSKLGTPEDLEHIASLGFRGEALASVGSVARCALYSRPAGHSVGARIENEGGRVSDVREAGGPTGTIVEVRDLFFNTPARRRFLKRTSTELTRCLDVIQRVALAHPGVGFVATHEGRRLFDVEAQMDLLARIRRTFGAELADSLVPVEAEGAGVRVSGYVAPPRFARRDTGRQMWFLNGRFLRDKVLTRVMREAYRGLMVEERHPSAFLSLSIDPAQVDVNVHPAKAEVRFREQRRLFGFLVGALRAAAGQTDMATPGERLVDTMQRRTDRAERLQSAFPNPGPLPARREPIEVREVEGRPYELPRPEAGSAEGSEWEARDDLAGPFLQVGRTYLVRTLPDGFEVVDQHALHERITFEELKSEVASGRVEMQRFLVPELVELPRGDVDLLGAHADAFLPIGIELSAFGETTIAVGGLPVRLRRPDVEELVRTLADVVGRTGQPPGPVDLIDEVLHSSACRSSVMAGDVLREDEIRTLLQRGRALDSDQTCPHGRPTRVRFTLADLEKAFQRK